VRHLLGGNWLDYCPRDRRLQGGSRRESSRALPDALHDDALIFEESPVLFAATDPSPRYRYLSRARNCLFMMYTRRSRCTGFDTAPPNCPGKRFLLSSSTSAITAIRTIALCNNYSSNVRIFLSFRLLRPMWMNDIRHVAKRSFISSR